MKPSSPASPYRIFLDVLCGIAAFLSLLTLFIAFLEARGELDETLTLLEKLIEFLGRGSNRIYLLLALLALGCIVLSGLLRRFPGVGLTAAVLPLAHFLNHMAERDSWTDYKLLLFLLLTLNLFGRLALPVLDRLRSPRSLALQLTLPAFFGAAVTAAVPLAARAVADGALLESTWYALFPKGLTALLNLSESGDGRFYLYLSGFLLFATLMLLWSAQLPLPGLLSALLPAGYALRASWSGRLPEALPAMLLLALLPLCAGLILHERAAHRRTETA